MLDDINWLRQRDASGTLEGMRQAASQTQFDAAVLEAKPSHADIKQVVMAGMGGSALAADMIKVLTEGWLHIPLTVVKGYDLPGYVGPETLVIAVSHSGNTEETLSAYQQAQHKGAALAALASGGKLLEAAKQDHTPHIAVPNNAQPRMSMIYHLRGLLKLLQHFSVIDGDLYQQVAASGDWLKEQAVSWGAEIAEVDNYAKQLAKQAIGKTPEFFAGELTWPLAYKWKISWNESAKNLAFHNQYPEFNHNEFMGWTSHPIEKPFVIFDLRSNLERPRIIERMNLSDRLLSGKRPKANIIELQGDTLLRQLLWGLVLADYASIYTGLLNGVDPAPVPLIEKFKRTLS